MLKKKTIITYWTFVGLTVAAILLAISSIELWLILPRGFFATRHIWINIHKWTGFSLFMLVLIHLFLNWRWIFQISKRHLSSVFKKQRRQR